MKITSTMWQCWFKHRYKVTAYDDKNFVLGHLHPWAGCRVECERCGKLYWDDRRVETRFPKVCEHEPMEVVSRGYNRTLDKDIDTVVGFDTTCKKCKKKIKATGWTE